MSDRRGFLRQLCALPMIGGGVKLIGAPSATAVPVTDGLHERYFAWLAHEHRAAVREHRYRAALARAYRTPWPANAYDPSPQGFVDRSMREGMDYIGWLPEAPDIERAMKAAPASSRAALVMSAVGVPIDPVRA